jgi:hypothetical protein
MRSIGSSGTPDEWILPVKIRRRKIEMNRTVLFIEEKFTKGLVIKEIKGLVL